jgi:20S proteasome subunit alpha 7
MKTLYASYRPIGTSVIMAVHDIMKGLQLYMVEPSGTCYQYYGCASGRGKQLCRNEIEKTHFKDLTVEEALPKVAKILLQAQEEMKDKKQELELSYISESSQFKHKILDRATVNTLTEQALREIKGEDAEMK